MGLFIIQTSTGPQEQAGTIIKIGKGKTALAALGIHSETYRISHIPSGKLVSRGYEYLSQARIISREIIEALGESLRDTNLSPEAFSVPLKMYIHERWLTRNIPTLAEYIESPDYEFRAKYSHPGGGFSSREAEEHVKELQGWDTTIAWIPSEKGTLPGHELQQLIDGKPLNI